MHFVKIVGESASKATKSGEFSKIFVCREQLTLMCVQNSSKFGSRTVAHPHPKNFVLDPCLYRRE